jgi:hypothetical protein
MPYISGDGDGGAIEFESGWYDTTTGLDAPAYGETDSPSLPFLLVLLLSCDLLPPPEDPLDRVLPFRRVSPSLDDMLDNDDDL